MQNVIHAVLVQDPRPNVCAGLCGQLFQGGLLIRPLVRREAIHAQMVQTEVRAIIVSSTRWVGPRLQANAPKLLFIHKSLGGGVVVGWQQLQVRVHATNGIQILPSICIVYGGHNKHRCDFCDVGFQAMNGGTVGRIAPDRMDLEGSNDCVR